MNDLKVGVVGLGYVGLPVAVEFAKKNVPVIGFDISQKRIEDLIKGQDYTNEISSEVLLKTNINFTCDASEIKSSNFIIVCVPTPIDEDNVPDLTALITSSRLVGENLSKNSIVVYESTVYPGVTEDVCLPILEQSSGMKLGDFKIGYSPERINPGDKKRTINKIKKIVSGCDEETLEKVANAYSLIVDAGIHKAPNIKTAEAAKVIENIQRDLNIALMNELAKIFGLMNIKTSDVLEAAGTKWNFHKYNPGLVGGHCIGIDPYYLTHKAQQLGYDAKVILAGRAINNSMPKYLSDLVVKHLPSKDSKILLLGLTFKENVPDLRNSKAKCLIKELKNEGFQVLGCEPLLEDRIIFETENLPFDEVESADCVVTVNKHDAFKNITLDDLKAKGISTILDLKQLFDENEAKKKGFNYINV